MGNGGSGKGTRGLSGGSSVTDYDGSKIDLRDNPLKYGDDDKALDSETRKTVSEFEDRRARSGVEYAQLVDKDGNVINEIRGGKESTTLKREDLIRAYILTHIHPREKDIIGGAFSLGDIEAFHLYTNLGILRAVSKEGIYSMAKTADFNGDALKTALTQENEKMAQ